MGDSFWPWVIVIGLFALAIFGIVSMVNNKETKASLPEKIKTPDFNPDTVLAKIPVVLSIPFGAAIDRSTNRICLIAGDSYRYIDGSDLIESEVLIDGETVTKTSRASQFSGAAVGGILFGGVGAVVGGLSGKKTTSVDAKGVKLRLVVNDIHQPFHDIDFIEMVSTGKTLPEAAVREAKEWHALFSTIIKINQRQTVNEKELNLVEPDNPPGSFSAEIKGAYDLLLSGALTEEEFERVKKGIISKWKNDP